MPLTGSLTRRSACFGYTTRWRVLARTPTRQNITPLTDELQEERQAVEEEEGDVQEEKERLDAGEGLRVLLQPRERDVDGSGTHSDGELKRRSQRDV